MPEYLAPGVYVVEIGATAHSIPGVPTRIDDEDLRALALAMRERLGRFSPDWTDFNNSDPGVTVLELVAWISEALIYRAGSRPERSRLHAARLAAAALTLADHHTSTSAGVLSSPRLLSGWRAHLVRWIAH